MRSRSTGANCPHIRGRNSAADKFASWYMADDSRWRQAARRRPSKSSASFRLRNWPIRSAWNSSSTTNTRPITAIIPAPDYRAHPDTRGCQNPTSLDTPRNHDPQTAQRLVCARFGVDPFPLRADAKVGVSRNVYDGIYPLHGLRHPPAADMSGWYIWAGDVRSDDPDFFAPLHVELSSVP
jgi:hypothetical protein